MCITQRIVIVTTSILLLLLLSISLATVFDVRAQKRTLWQPSIVQAQRLQQPNAELAKGQARINGSAFDRASVYLPATEYMTSEPTPVSEAVLSSTSPPASRSSVNPGEGTIGEKISQTQPKATGDGYIGTIKTATPSASPATPSPQQLPTLALLYSGSGGPKHCRGSLIQQLSFSPTEPRYNTNGTCITLPSMARCGVFFAGKGAGCEADLFTVNSCVNTTATYLNTVVFMPEERTVGGYWKSMRVRCGVKAPEAKILDPVLLGGLIDSSNKAGGDMERRSVQV